MDDNKEETTTSDFYQSIKAQLEIKKIFQIKFDEKVKEDGGPAFPRASFYSQGSIIGNVAFSGMTLRQYAAIQLRVPDSGIDWLDEMIVKAKRDEFAGHSLSGIGSANIITREDKILSKDDVAKYSYQDADSMLEEGSKK